MNKKADGLEEIKKTLDENNKMLKLIVERFFDEKPHKFFQKKPHNREFKEE